MYNNWERYKYYDLEQLCFLAASINIAPLSQKDRVSYGKYIEIRMEIIAFVTRMTIFLCCVSFSLHAEITINISQSLRQGHRQMLSNLCSQANAISVFENLLADLTVRPGSG